MPTSGCCANKHPSGDTIPHNTTIPWRQCLPRAGRATGPRLPPPPSPMRLRCSLARSAAFVARHSRSCSRCSPARSVCAQQREQRNEHEWAIHTWHGEERRRTRAERSPARSVCAGPESSARSMRVESHKAWRGVSQNESRGFARAKISTRGKISITNKRHIKIHI